MEEWKAIPGYEGLYEASSEGRIRTAEGKVTSNARYSHRVWKQRIMKQQYGARKSGPYLDARVKLWKDGKVKDHLVSRLVAITFVDGYQDGMTVNHKNGNPLNNSAENLEWVSLEKNIRHAFDNGLMSTQKQCVLIGPSGDKKRFMSQCAASKWIGRTESYISQCISAGRPIRAVSGEVYEIF